MLDLSNIITTAVISCRKYVAIREWMSQRGWRWEGVGWVVGWVGGIGWVGGWLYLLCNRTVWSVITPARILCQHVQDNNQLLSKIKHLLMYFICVCIFTA